MKTTNDLLVLRSDVYALGDDGRLQAQVARIPEVDLDPKHYRLIEDFDRLMSVVPSLRNAAALVVRGEWRFDTPVSVTGELELADARGNRGATRDGPVAGRPRYALTGCELQLAETGRPDPHALVEGLDAAGWPASRVAEHAAAQFAAEVAWPQHVPAALRAGCGAAQFSAALGLARELLHLTTIEVRAPSGRLNCAHLVGEVAAGVMRRERREHHDAPGADGKPVPLRLVAEALEADRCVHVAQGALAVDAGHHAHAAVLGRGVGERDPTREVGLRLDVGVPVVLVPQHGLGRLRLLVHGLFPVEPSVGTDEITAEAGEQRLAAELVQVRRLDDEVGCDGLGVDTGDAEPTLGQALQELVVRGSRPVRSRPRGARFHLVEGILDHEETLLVERPGLLGGDRGERGRVVGPLEPAVPRMGFEGNARGRHVTKGRWHTMAAILRRHGPPTSSRPVDRRLPIVAEGEELGAERVLAVEGHRAADDGEVERRESIAVEVGRGRFVATVARQPRAQPPLGAGMLQFRALGGHVLVDVVAVLGHVVGRDPLT